MIQKEGVLDANMHSRVIALEDSNNRREVESFMYELVSKLELESLVEVNTQSALDKVNTYQNGEYMYANVPNIHA